jgi:lipid-binding SYLF domain-containing protein
MKENYKHMNRLSIGLAVMASMTGSMMAAGKDDVARRLEESATVLSEVMSVPDKAIPNDLLEKAHCIVIVPGLKKGAFIVGGKYGKGFISCRRQGHSGWSAPAAVRVEGGSFGFQIGGSETDVILLVMNERGGDRLLQSKFTLGAEGEIAGGPVGRSTSAQTDAKMTAEILSWSRSRGLFAGVSLQGATLREDLDDNRQLYGEPLKNADIIRTWHAPTPEAASLLRLLKQYSPREL